MNKHNVGRRDANEPQILEVCTRMGYPSFEKAHEGVKGYYIPFRIGQGCDFLLCGPFGMAFVEVKNPAMPPSKRQLTDDEKKMQGLAQKMGMQYFVIETPEEMAEVIGCLGG